MITLQKIKKENLKELYSIIYTGENPEWSKYNAPYFNEYKYLSLETFLLTNHHEFFLSARCRGIFVDNKLVGIVTKYWESFATLWLEVGIVIYDENYWSKGIGEHALKLWIRDCFDTHPEIARLGLTTWSGNIGMIRLAEKLGLTLEGCLRKVRYYNGIYYDSMKYGVLREEFFADNLPGSDCTYTTQSGTFNYRVAAVIINENKILISSHNNENFYYLPGGRVQFGETSIKALERELNEELNLSNFDHTLLWLNQNFFTQDRVKYHELCFYYKVLLDKNSLNFSAVDNDKELHFKWVTLTELEDINLVPEFLKQKLSNLPTNPQEIINHE